ncbi:DNA cytosine methyltransferase [Sphingobium lignivorans]|uniref:DNA (Cytosine-5)-methyltransferase 1 n=1 Tax=Sphingobium lignivorans TaxID=2735886 RepID=A0ABR6NFE9_9SPHN|nr:DNA cytosine methyltransferase [Sphingobium lignivorans]MBB5986013.1 DNA (cytosine-5)-methyltransferase 1 [Sphingobium lignivorans]
MTAFYNECDPYAAQWLRNLIDAGHIAPGIVDERDIRDITPAELFEYDQCHFFAGIGVWPYALRRAGWADDRRIWTGSCPCQPFSAAGRAGGFADERHLWPHWFHLISQCSPPVILGEQVASKDGLAWNDLVSVDMEAAGYAFGAVDICAAGITVDWESSQAGEWLRRAIHDCSDPGVTAMLRDFADWAGAGNLGDGGEHIRQRQYFVGVADASSSRAGRHTGAASGAEARSGSTWHPDGHDGGDTLFTGSSTGRLDHHHHQGPQGLAGNDGEALGQRQGSERPASEAGVSDGLDDDDDDRRASASVTGLRDAEHHAEPRGGAQRMADGPHSGRGEERPDVGGIAVGDRTQGLPAGHSSSSSSDHDANAPQRGRPAVDWLFCRDGKWRAVESGTFPLAHEAPARVGRLRAYGNALDAETATEFISTIKAILDGEPDAAVRSDGGIDFEDLIG